MKSLSIRLKKSFRTNPFVHDLRLFKKDEREEKKTEDVRHRVVKRWGGNSHE